MKICAVVPVKALRWSKQRLAPALGDRRSGFAKALLNQTLVALGGARHVTAILVVTEDREVADEARRANAEVLEVGADLNAACTLGLLEARARVRKSAPFFTPTWPH
jgi:2-phospho-L-lactate guanylyltransferase (CobY/MobA/RfbA family)